MSCILKVPTFVCRNVSATRPVTGTERATCPLISLGQGPGIVVRAESPVKPRPHVERKTRNAESILEGGVKVARGVRLGLSVPIIKIILVDVICGAVTRSPAPLNNEAAGKRAT